MSEFWIFVNIRKYDRVLNMRRDAVTEEFMKLGHFDKHFVKNTRKSVSAGKAFGSFSPRYY